MDAAVESSVSSDDSTVDSLGALNIRDYKTERVNQLGFEPQKEIPYNRYLPYSHCLDAEALDYLSLIKANIARTLCLNDKHGFQWISDLSK